MDAQQQQALGDQLLALADDELVLAHRNSEWTGHGPILEEDIAFSNIAQDELGHAILWYRLLNDLTGDDPDQLVFFRDAADYRNVQMVELTKGDWAFSMVRQYLFDALEMVRLPRLAESHYRPLAEAAAKIRPEELYHYRHTHAWVKRLGLGTAESQQRTQKALDELWPYAYQLFAPLPDEALLVKAGLLPAQEELRQAWEGHVVPFLASCDLRPPVRNTPPAQNRDEHTPHLEALLADMQVVARAHPGAEW
ncbi:MAG: phenylacetate-CoA oxygenase subunit PaaC [Chloroflexi bacterium]|nr:phenylacetate-CoA oxygenase subunit PaaC [Chloroflexota bacterium]MCI0577501.1 phenylacetate-CoA oxygenase subunit PaaC [Chloroflexota bacterium]MCI0645661.1 phenylacetate-CoA oxygenase subunit PaaC [Chloroflexota bacterium]MCI0725573.1 phenylacetate-CoA oxygenase subunit PaaC [Chloroflexota bacterium]